MRIAVIGATGNLGGAVAREASTRGHQVTALSSTDLDVRDPLQIHRSTAGHDAVVVSVKGGDGLVSRAAAALVEAHVARLLFIGGGGSLLDPSGRRYVDAPHFPAQYKQTTLDQAAALRILVEGGNGIAWSYLSPPPVHLVPGDRTGRYRAEARDTPITDERGESRITVADFAAAAVDALEQHTFVRQRFTVAY
ncbi:NAD(P)-dependent oxidoreductase [Plantactinospora sp. GCM10030261]|uniref:NAD(P)-dependent oxidoreductase n=1 Tax=Plantactinospora sp. GCM10030261 TaxID=3273420 RepID=UPI00362198A4